MEEVGPIAIDYSLVTQMASDGINLPLQSSQQTLDAKPMPVGVLIVQQNP